MTVEVNTCWWRFSWFKYTVEVNTFWWRVSWFKYTTEATEDWKNRRLCSYSPPLLRPLRNVKTCNPWFDINKKNVVLIGVVWGRGKKKETNRRGTKERREKEKPSAVFSLGYYCSLFCDFCHKHYKILETECRTSVTPGKLNVTIVVWEVWTQPLF